MTLEVIPNTIRYELLLTTTTPVSHHDAAEQDKSNRSLFNRQKQFIQREGSGAFADAEWIGIICGTHLVPVDLTMIMESLTFHEFVSIALIRLFIDMYNSQDSQDGAGLFSGMERYRFLETRAHQAAVSAGGLREFWDRLTRDLQVPIHPQKYDVTLLDLLSLPRGTQQQMLATLSGEYRSAVAIARQWHAVAKLGDERYAEAVGKMAMVQPLQTMHYEPDTSEIESMIVAQVPTVSTNGIRHQLVREPAYKHLFGLLGLLPGQTPGQGPLPQGAEALFYNGGNIASGSKQPSNTHWLAHQVREAYPSLALVGGVVDAFDLGESLVSTPAWIVCRENAAAIGHDLPQLQTSVFSMIDDVTWTRQAGHTGEGQMIYSFETLATGTQILCRFNLSPFAPLLVHGALVTALQWWLDNDATLCGKGAQGLGQCVGEWLERPRDPAEMRGLYEAYLAENRDKLVAGLTEGTLCSDSVLCKQ